jgi:predicted 3-demethylubiquinone-9 3-methyltransferase (glyoxalase superfamily)
MSTTSQGITPHLWFDNDAKQAAEFFCSVFPKSKISNITVLHDTPSDTPSGDTDILTFTLSGQPFMAINAGPLFKFNPAISFMVNFDPLRDPDASKNLDKAWEKLSEGGKQLMPLQEYPFSKRFGWIEDKYGLSWQLILTNPEGEKRPFIIPALMFAGKKAGQAEDAINFYLSVFKNTKKGPILRFPKSMEPDKEGTVQFADLMVEGTWFALMDSAYEHGFDFNEAISFIVNCEDQRSVDYYWEKLSAVPEAEQCGWLKDKFGVSWQITPTAMDEMLTKGTRDQMDRVTQAFLPMKKIIIADLEKAYKGGK